MPDQLGSSRPEFIPAEEMLRERDLAALWKVSRRTLQRWRAEGKGPAFTKIGDAIRYPLADALAYQERHRVEGDR